MKERRRHKGWEGRKGTGARHTKGWEERRCTGDISGGETVSPIASMRTL